MVVSFRLNLRVMPDPKGFGASIGSNSSVGDQLDTQNSAENLRRNMHKVMQSRQRQVEGMAADEKQKLEPISGSDVDSLRSSESSQNLNPTIRTFHSKQASAPADTSQPVSSMGPPALPPRSVHLSGSTDTLTMPAGNIAGSAAVNLSMAHQPGVNSSIVPVPGPIPQVPIAGNSDKLSPRVFAGFNTGAGNQAGIGRKTPVPVPIPTVPGTANDHDVFVKPKTPGIKPPVPERKPMGGLPRPNMRAPLPPPAKVSYMERPKSTPPVLPPRVPQYNIAEDTEYDSDPGNLSSMSATMSMENTLGGPNVSTLSMTGLGDHWGGTIADIETPKEKRRFSENFFLFNKVCTVILFCGYHRKKKATCSLFICAPIFEPTGAHARWALMHRLPSVRPSVRLSVCD